MRIGFDDNRQRLARFVVLIADADLSGDHDPDRLDAAMLPGKLHDLLDAELEAWLARALCLTRNEVGSFTRPLMGSSPGDDITGAIKKVGDAGVRTALHDAANALLTRATKPSTLKRWAMDVAKRRSIRRAKVALVRKLATALHRTWVDGTEFV